jgi:hypothetical protein
MAKTPANIPVEILPAWLIPTAALSVDVAEATADEADEAAEERRWVTPATALQKIIVQQNSIVEVSICRWR